ncbi:MULTISPECIES: DUF3566 domain-containing protein [unclassified Rhodococcus (in: high G+C Gram-positive bacteria)]|uniref:DUF3566 domain-containing protein n=1 Tax=unclassified Rhodococcus (in: high G+C Gram-positive bacteria) TaxID=192944 RepID=UPI0005D36A74|nr:MULTISPECIES: DUF3566 domain-containing protein [unclassified Rhodococcus (in: high G+C Gram-positive bacteria)]KJF24891.1 hypothetical protein SZ00_01814 [Rhodococcus sp. AD45]
MSTPNQPGSDQKSTSTSGSTPPKAEQPAAPAGAGGSQSPVEASKPPAAGKPSGSAADSKAVADKSAQPAAGKSAPAAPAAPKAPDAPAPANQARGNQAPPWQRGQQQSGPQPVTQQAGAQQPVTQQPGVQQREPQTNITRPAAPRPDVRKGPAPAAGKPPVGPPNQRPTGPGSPSQPPARPVVTGTAAPKVTNNAAMNNAVDNKTVANKTVADKTVANKTVANKTVAPPKGPNAPAGNAPAGPRAKAAAIDGPTRHISRKDLPKDMPDLSEAKHPLPQAAVGDKNHVAAVAAASSGGPLRATVQIRRIDPWSTLKITSVISVSLFFVWMVAVGLLYVVLDGMGVWDRLNNAFTDIVSDGGSDGLVTAGQVFGYSAVIGLANMVLFTALVTIGSFIYNLCSDLVGGVEVTLADRD